MTTAAAATPVQEAAHTEKQPGVLYMLFATEAWERFSYYGMRAVLVLYMMSAVKGLGFPQEKASIIYGFYTGLVYLTPLLGGFLADRVMGYRNAILFGGVVMAIGQLLLSVPSVPFFFSGLGALIIGNGFFKPNISTIVGTLYREGDPRRDRGFTIFYMGINLGAMFSPLVCGTLGKVYGFPWAFRSAGIGMLVGVLTFFIGQRFLGERGKAPKHTKQSIEAGDAATGGYRADPKVVEEDVPLTADEKKRVLAIFLVAILMVFFWMAFEQAGNTMTTWADERTDRVFFGFELDASYFQTVNPLFILLLAPLVSQIWKILDAKNREPSTPMKMVLGLAIVGIGFIPMVMATLVAGEHGKASATYLLLAYFLHTVGELCLSPIGLSFVTKLAPKKLAALLMGTWFLPVFLGNLLAGLTGSLYSAFTKTTFFSIFVVTSLIAAAVMLAMTPFIRRLMGNVR
jgi:POT family proton-dependent oligopeptide transporter